MRRGTEQDRERVRRRQEFERDLEEGRQMRADGFRALEADWRMFRGAYQGDEYRVTSLHLGRDGKTIWVKTNIPEDAGR